MEIACDVARGCVSVTEDGWPPAVFLREMQRTFMRLDTNEDVARTREFDMLWLDCARETAKETCWELGEIAQL